MELNNKPAFMITTIFLLSLILSAASVSAGRSEVAEAETVYEIDYKGPETHSSINPPPGHRHATTKDHYSKLNCLRACHGQHGESVHG